MIHYIITHKLATELGCVGQRKGNATDGYLVNSADMNIDTVAVNASEIKEVSLEDAKVFAKNHKI